MTMGDISVIVMGRRVVSPIGFSPIVAMC